MEAQQNVEVKLISTEFVKPSSPTPPTHKSFTLSYLDKCFPAVVMPFHLVHVNSTTVATQPNNDDIIRGLKTSLAQTLTTFYPLAGRCNDEYTVTCDDQGVLFNETRVDCRLSDVLNSSRKLDLFSKFLPPIDIFSLVSQPISEFIPLSFQINIFQCGGIVISCYFLHKLLDASSLSCFLNHWAAIASKRYDGLVQPNFKATVAAFPPPPPKVVGKHVNVATQKDNNTNNNNNNNNNNVESMAMLWHRLASIKVVGKSFIFSRIVIDQLKGKAATTTLPYPTGFEVVAGFVWRNIMAPVTTPDDDEEPVPTTLIFTINVRPRTTPPLPKESMGNLIVDVYATADKCGELSDHVAEIHRAISTVGKKVEPMLGENGEAAYLAEKEVGLFKGSLVNGRKATTYRLSSWSRFGFNEVDFGFGKPSKVVPVGMIHPFTRNTMGFLDYSDSDGDGIEVWLFLEEKEMHVLESSEQFRAFASSSW